MADAYQQEALRRALGELAEYKRRRSLLHSAVQRASDLGATQTQIATASGLSRQWVAKLTARKPDTEETP